jgi:hypothetical protein
MTTAHMFWHGPLTQFQVGSMLSIQKAGFDVVVWSIDPLELPTGIENRDSGELVDKKLLDEYSYIHWKDADYPKEKSRAVFYSDLVRIYAVAKHGGWWFDCDIFCVKPVEWFDMEYKQHKILIGSEFGGDYVSNAAFAIPDPKLAEKLITLVEQLLSLRKVFHWGELGPVVFNTLIKNELPGYRPMPWYTFYSTLSHYAGLWVDDPIQRALAEATCKHSAGIHWYNNQMYKLADGGDGIDPNSYMGQLFATLPQEELLKFPVSN